MSQHIPLLRVSLYSEAPIVNLVQICELRSFLLTCCHNVQCRLQPIVHGEGKFVFGAEHTECIPLRRRKSSLFSSRFVTIAAFVSPVVARVPDAPSLPSSEANPPK